MIEKQDVDFARIEYFGNTGMPLKEIILSEINDWKNSKDREQMILGQKYYKGDTDIKNKKKMSVGEGGVPIIDRHLANNKLMHQFTRKLVDQKVGYLLSKPITIQADEESYKNKLDEFFDKGFMKLIKNLGKDAINKGISWVQVYIENNELKLMRIPSEQCIPLWKDAEHSKLDGMIRKYSILSYEGKNKRKIEKVEYWTTDGVKYYVLDGNNLIEDVERESGTHFKVKNSYGEVKEQYNWDKVPFIYFKYNDEEQPLITFIKSLVDDYDKQRSLNADNIEDLPNSIYVLKGYENQELGEFRQKTSQFRAVKVNEDGDVDALSIDIDTEAYKNHIEQTRQDIYEFGRGVDIRPDKFGNAPSGISLQMLYTDLDLDCNIIETEFQASLSYLMYFVNNHISNVNKIKNKEVENVKDIPVEFIFNRNMLINTQEIIASCKNSIGIISNETIVANHPWASANELEKIEKEEESEIEKHGDYPGLGENVEEK